MCDPILFTPLKMQPHYSQSSRENATPSSGTSPLASYNEVPPLPPGPPVPIPGTLRTSSYFTDSSVFVPTRKAIRKIINTYPICQSPLKRSARRCFAPLRKSRQNHRSMCEQKPYRTTTLLACVASVFNRVIARKVERELKANGKAKGREKRKPSLPSPPPSFLFSGFVQVMENQQQQQNFINKQIKLQTKETQN